MWVVQHFSWSICKKHFIVPQVVNCYLVILCKVHDFDSCLYWIRNKWGFSYCSLLFKPRPKWNWRFGSAKVQRNCLLSVDTLWQYDLKNVIELWCSFILIGELRHTVWCWFPLLRHWFLCQNQWWKTWGAGIFLI